MKRVRLSLFAIYLTYFVDMLSWAIVFPIFAPYFLDVDNVLFASAVSAGTRATILGLFLMAFSLGQFLGAPVVGECADKYGRRRILIVTVFFTLVGLILSAWSMQKNALIALFFGRFVTGIFASTTTICLSSLSDLSVDETVKAKRFGYLSMIAGLAFLIGAYLGGKLSDPTTSFHPYYPLWIAAGFTLVNLLFVVFGFQETVQHQKAVTFHFFQSFQNIKMALRTKKIKRVYFLYFLFIFSWTLLFQFLPVLTVKKFAFTSSDLGDLALFMGVCWIIGSSYLNKIALRYLSLKLFLAHLFLQG